MFMMTALFAILVLYIIRILVLVLVRNEDSAVGHARNRMCRNWFLTAEVA